jgi:hypothetical protein
LPGDSLYQLDIALQGADGTPPGTRATPPEHHKDGNWITARAADVPTLAATLGIQYRELPDRSFNHSTVISVTDRDGAVRARTGELNGPDPAFLTAMRAQLAIRSLRP